MKNYQNDDQASDAVLHTQIYIKLLENTLACQTPRLCNAVAITPVAVLEPDVRHHCVSEVGEIAQASEERCLRRRKLSVNRLLICHTATLRILLPMLWKHLKSSGR